MCISEKDLTDRVYKVSIFYRDADDHVHFEHIRLYATSQLGAMRRATNLVNDWIKQHEAFSVCGVFLSSESSSWGVHRLYDAGVAFTPWIDKLPAPEVK